MQTNIEGLLKGSASKGRARIRFETPYRSRPATREIVGVSECRGRRGERTESIPDAERSPSETRAARDGRGALVDTLNGSTPQAPVLRPHPQTTEERRRADEPRVEPRGLLKYAQRKRDVERVDMKLLSERYHGSRPLGHASIGRSPR